MSDRQQNLRIVEAILFASAEPIDPRVIAARLPEGTDVDALLEELAGLYANRGVNVCRRDGRWAIRTAPDLAPHLQIETEQVRKLSRAAIEALAVIAYHQPITRAEIEEIRGVQLSRGTLDMLLECGWIKPGRRRRTPGRPVTWMTTPAFLDHFGLESIEDLPGLDELKAAGLIDARPAIQAFSAAALGGIVDQEGGEEEGSDDDAHPLGADDLGDDIDFTDDDQPLNDEDDY